MKIDINDDFDTAFQNEIFAGFTLKQCIAAGVGLAAGVGSAAVLWYYTGLPIVQCSYIVVPVMVPFCAVGFFTYQSQSPIKLIKEMWYVHQTEYLSYQAAERPERTGRIFTTKRQMPKKKKEESPWPYLMRTSGSGSRNG